MESSCAVNDVYLSHPLIDDIDFFCFATSNMPTLTDKHVRWSGVSALVVGCDREPASVRGECWKFELHTDPSTLYVLLGSGWLTPSLIRWDQAAGGNGIAVTSCGQREVK